MARHLLSQGAPALDDAGILGVFVASDGKRSAVGHLLGDHYQPEMEGSRTPYNRPVQLALEDALDEAIQQRDVDLLDAVERMELTFAPSEWRGRLRDVAAQFGLTMEGD